MITAVIFFNLFGNVEHDTVSPNCSARPCYRTDTLQNAFNFLIQSCRAKWFICIDGAVCSTAVSSAATLTFDWVTR